MKNILLVILVIATTQVNAQFEKGNWFLGASSSNINFSSSTNSENTIDVTFTGFKDTLVNATDSCVNSMNNVKGIYITEIGDAFCRP